MTTTISNEYLTATISHKGAELQSLTNHKGREYMWSGDPKFWAKHSPVLFPIVGTLKENRYEYGGNIYTLNRHGFARDMEFELLGSTKDSAVLSLRNDVNTLKHYPFEFELQLAYTLSANKLRVQYKVINPADSELLFSIGAHPAFALPDGFGSYSVEIGHTEPLRYYMLEEDLLSERSAVLQTQNNRFRLDYALFENDALVFKELEPQTVTLFENETRLLNLSFPGFPYLGLWTKQQAPFICIEPWFGHSDTKKDNGRLSQKEGIQLLTADQLFEASFTITIY